MTRRVACVVLTLWLSFVVRAVAQDARGGSAGDAGAASPDRVAALESELAKRKRWREAWREECKAVKNAYEDTSSARTNTQKKLDTETGAAREVLVGKLKKADEAFIDASFSAYVCAATDRDLELQRQIRDGLFIAVSTTQDWHALFTAVEARARISGEVPKDVAELFHALSEKVALARALQAPENRASVRRFLEELRKKYPDQKKNLSDGITGSFGAAFDALRGLSEEAFRYAASHASQIAHEVDPEARVQRERPALGFVVEEGATSEAFTEGFVDAAKAWIRAGSPDHELNFLLLADWGQREVAQLIQTASGILRSTDPNRSPCPADVSTHEEQAASLLCRTYGMAVVIELRKGPSGPVAHASWAAREEGKNVVTRDRFPNDGFALPAIRDQAIGERSADKSEGTLRGGEFALQILNEIGLYKGISRVFPLKPCSEGDGPPPLVQRKASPWLAAAWAGAPWLADGSPRNDTVGYLFGVVDAVALVAGLALGGVALGAHKANWQSDDKWMAASVTAFSVGMGTRLASGVGYFIAEPRPDAGRTAGAP